MRAPNRAVSLALVLLAPPACARCGCEPELELRPPTVDEALVGLPRDRAFTATLDTDAGAIRCTIDPTRAPQAVAMFVGFATGRATFRDPRTGELTRRAMYRDLSFHRAVKDLMLQTGDPIGDASGYPGYRVPVEHAPDDRARLSVPGALVLARYTAPPNRKDPNPPPAGHVHGSQFALLLTAMPHLDGLVSVLGRCDDLERARAIAQDVAGKRAQHRLLSVRVAR